MSASEAGTPALKPVEEQARVGSLDYLRGIALLGILVMNIYAFSMPFPAYTNPLQYGGAEGLDYQTWVVTHLFADQKFMAVFSALFGAGFILMTQRAEARGQSFGKIFYRRQGWLMVIGILHAYFLWFGDILFSYGFCGLILYPLRRWAARRLVLVGILVLAVAPVFSFGMGTYMSDLRDRALQAEARQEAGETLSPQDEELQEQWAEMSEQMVAGPEVVEEQLEIHRGGYFGIFVERAPFVFAMQTVILAMMVFWRAGGLMLLGMGLMKMGFFSAERSPRAYGLAALLGYGLGLPIVYYGFKALEAQQFDSLYGFRSGYVFNYVGSLGISLGHASLALLLWKLVSGGWLRRALGAVGRMALTNYLMHSVLLTTLFYGYGGGLYGHVNRFPQMGIVVAVWVLQLIWSPLWLHRFRFGPAEWLWRSLTYGSLQPFRRQPALRPSSRAA